MRKSEGNAINLDDSPRDIFGKTMSIPDAGIAMMALASTPMVIEEVEAIKVSMREGINPKDQKLKVAEAMTGLVYGKEIAKKEKENFLKTFSKKEIPDDAPELVLTEPEISAVDLVLLSGVAESRSEAKRLIEHGALEIGGRIEKDVHAMLLPQSGEVVRIGKKYFARIRTTA